MTDRTLSSLPLSRGRIDFENWSKEVTGNNILTWAPRSGDELGSPTQRRHSIASRDGRAYCPLICPASVACAVKSTRKQIKIASRLALIAGKGCVSLTASPFCSRSPPISTSPSAT